MFKIKKYKNTISIFLFLFSISAFSQKTGDDAATYLERGNTKNKLGNYYGAIKDFNKAIELNPDDTETY